MTAGEFSLRAIVTGVVAEMDTEDRERIVKEIEHRVPADQIPEAFRQALPAFVHASTAHRWAFPTPEPAPEPEAQGTGKKGRASGRSAKVAGIRDAWRRYLEGRYTVADGSLRRLGDLGQQDLIFLASEMDKKARAAHARSAAMKALAAAMAEHEVTRVRDLPSGFLAEFFGTAS